MIGAQVNRTAPTAAPWPRPGLDSLPLLIHLVGIYIAAPLVLPGGLEFPVVTTLVTVPLLLAINAPRVRVSHLGWLAGLVGLAAVTVVLAPQAGAYFGPRVKGLVLWAYSLVCAYALILEVTRWPREYIARLMLGFSLVLLAGCLLEVSGLLRPVSDAFRRVAFPTGALVFRARDLEIAGFERPRLFVSEPSDVAKFLLLTSFAYVSLSASRFRHAVGLGLCVVATALTRSPIAVLLLPLQGLVMALGRPLVPGPRPMSRPLAAVVLVVAAVLVTGFATALLADRIQQAAEGRDASSVIRVVAPVVIAWETLNASPWWGAGISGTESIEQSIVLGFELAGIATLADPTALNSEMKLANLVGNAFWLHWINFGLLGGLLAIWLLRGLMRSFGITRLWFAFGAIFVFSQTMGGAHAPYFWSFVGLSIAISWHLDSTGLLELRTRATAEDAVDLEQTPAARI